MEILSLALELDDPKTGVWMLVTDPAHIAEYLAEDPPPRGQVVTVRRLADGSTVTKRQPIGASSYCRLPG